MGVEFTQRQVSTALTNAYWDQSTTPDGTAVNLAGQMANRFSQIANTQDPETAVNLFNLVRDSIFVDPSGRPWSPAEVTPQELAKANSLLLGTLGHLGLESQRDIIAKAIQSIAAAPRPNTAEVEEAAERFSKIAYEDRIVAAARKAGLNVVNISWEDVSRVGTSSAWGENITDSRLRVVLRDPRSGKDRTVNLPIVRTSSNIEDVTADIDMSKFMVLVGNAQGGPLRKVSLRQVLETPWMLMTDPSKWPIRDAAGKPTGNLYVPGVDGQVLVTAQASILPVPKDGAVNYSPAAYSYTSGRDESGTVQPTVLTILVTPKGTSLSVLGKVPCGDTLWVNVKGERAPLKAQSSEDLGVDVRAGGGEDIRSNAGALNRVLVIQVPVTRKGKPYYQSSGIVLRGGPPAGRSVVTDAVISTGETEGPYDEDLGGLTGRDKRKPIRVTVQFAKAANPSLATDKMEGPQLEAIFASIAAELAPVTKDAFRNGSLVFPNPPK